MEESENMCVCTSVREHAERCSADTAFLLETPVRTCCIREAVHGKCAAHVSAIVYAAFLQQKDRLLAAKQEDLLEDIFRRKRCTKWDLEAASAIINAGGVSCETLAEARTSRHAAKIAARLSDPQKIEALCGDAAPADEDYFWKCTALAKTRRAENIAKIVRWSVERIDTTNAVLLRSVCEVLAGVSAETTGGLAAPLLRMAGTDVPRLRAGGITALAFLAHAGGKWVSAAAGLVADAVAQTLGRGMQDACVREAACVFYWKIAQGPHASCVGTLAGRIAAIALLDRSLVCRRAAAEALACGSGVCAALTRQSVHRLSGAMTALFPRAYAELPQHRKELLEHLVQCVFSTDDEQRGHAALVLVQLADGGHAECRAAVAQIVDRVQRAELHTYEYAGSVALVTALLARGADGAERTRLAELLRPEDVIARTHRISAELVLRWIAAAGSISEEGYAYCVRNAAHTEHAARALGQMARSAEYAARLLRDLGRTKKEALFLANAENTRHRSAVVAFCVAQLRGRGAAETKTYALEALGRMRVPEHADVFLRSMRDCGAYGFGDSARHIRKAALDAVLGVRPLLSASEHCELVCSLVFLCTGKAPALRAAAFDALRHTPHAKKLFVRGKTLEQRTRECAGGTDISDERLPLAVLLGSVRDLSGRAARAAAAGLCDTLLSCDAETETFIGRTCEALHVLMHACKDILEKLLLARARLRATGVLAARLPRLSAEQQKCRYTVRVLGDCTDVLDEASE